MEDADESSSEEEFVCSNDEKDNINEETNCTEVELEEYRKQFNDEIRYSEEKPKMCTKPEKSSIEKYLESVDKHLKNYKISEATIDSKKIEINNSIDDFIVNEQCKQEIDVINTENKEQETSNFEENELNDEIKNLDPNSRLYRLKMVEKVLSDARSMRSYSTTASTIAPMVVKDRIKKTIDAREQREIRKKCVAKGEASAATRIRRDNRDTCKQYAGWDF